VAESIRSTGKSNDLIENLAGCSIASFQMKHPGSLEFEGHTIPFG
jgi:hypothetical protein